MMIMTGLKAWIALLIVLALAILFIVILFNLVILLLPFVLVGIILVWLLNLLGRNKRKGYINVKAKIK